MRKLRHRLNNLPKITKICSRKFLRHALLNYFSNCKIISLMLDLTYIDLWATIKDGKDTG